MSLKNVRQRLALLNKALAQVNPKSLKEPAKPDRVADNLGSIGDSLKSLDQGDTLKSIVLALDRLSTKNVIDKEEFGQLFQRFILVLDSMLKEQKQNYKDISLKEPKVTVNIPKSDKPDITVNVPELPAPIIKVEPNIINKIPEQVEKLQPKIDNFTLTAEIIEKDGMNQAKKFIIKKQMVDS